MKKSLKSLFAILAISALIATPAFADGLGNYTGAVGAATHDYSQGGSNDFARVPQQVIPDSNGSLTNSAGASYQNNNTYKGWIGFQTGGGTANANACSDTFSKDLGYQSFSGAKSNVDSSAAAAGVAAGTKGATSFSGAAVNGNTFQYNQAGETGYGTPGTSNGANADGWSNSGAGYSGNASNSNSGKITGSAALIAGSSESKGFTNVQVDPNGNQKSASGITASSSKAQIAGCPTGSSITGVNGQGAMATNATTINPNNSKATAGAYSDYTYGATNPSTTPNSASVGAGVASNFSTVNTWQSCPNCNHSTATSGGFSASFAK